MVRVFGYEFNAISFLFAGTTLATGWPRKSFDVAVEVILIRKLGEKISEDTISTLLLPDQYFLRIL